MIINDNMTFELLIVIPWFINSVILDGMHRFYTNIEFTEKKALKKVISRFRVIKMQKI